MKKNITKRPATESHIHNNAQYSIKCSLIWSNYHELLLKKTQSVDR